MDEKISLEAISLYGNAYADKVLNAFFSDKSRISGKEILKLSNVQQVNLFVIKELFKSWKEETRKQKTVFFDYEAEEVKEALAQYMNVLSNHILIESSHFRPLFKKAVSQTLMVIFNPYDFFAMLIQGKNNLLEVQAFKEELKYLKVNKKPLERMLQKLEERNVAELAGNEAFAVLDEILEEVNFTPEDVEEYVRQFSEVAVLDPAKFFVPTLPVVETKHEPVVEKPAHQNPIAPPLETKKQEVVSNGVKPQAVMDNLRKISKIRENLSINQKFMFTKVLFYGDFESFSRVIDELDQLSNLREALEFLEPHSTTWDRDSKEFHEFMEMLEKRFS